MENNEIRYKGIKKSKIIIARIVDFCFLVVVSLITTILVMSITALTPSFQGMLKDAEQIQLESKLYKEDKKNDVYLITKILDVDEEMKTEDKNKILDENLTFFFTSERFFKNNEGLIAYNDLKKDAKKDDKNLFKLDGEKYIEDRTSGLHPSDYYEFYKNALENKAYKYLQNDKTYHDITKSVTVIIISEQVVCPIFSYLILYLLVPLFSFKNHNTLGFKTYKIGIVDGNGFTLSTQKALGATLFSCFFVGILSFFTFFIPLIVSFGFFMYRPDNKNLTGYLFNYYFVDVSNHKIYTNLDDAEHDEKRTSVDEDLFDNTPLEGESK